MKKLIAFGISASLLIAILAISVLASSVTITLTNGSGGIIITGTGSVSFYDSGETVNPFDSDSATATTSCGASIDAIIATAYLKDSTQTYASSTNTNYNSLSVSATTSIYSCNPTHGEGSHTLVDLMYSATAHSYS